MNIDADLLRGTTPTNQPVTILGAGLAGALMAILLGRRNVPVRVLERRPDLRIRQLSAGRSINLALADRGIHALKQAGVYEAVTPLLIPMQGRMLHDQQGRTNFVAYGQRPHEMIYSISRPGLNAVLLDHAEQLPGVELCFDQEGLAIDLPASRLQLTRHDVTHNHAETFQQLIAADGYQSVVRNALLDSTRATCTQDLLPHGYKELTIPANEHGKHRLLANALHIWPRGGFMLIALPNLDGSFTVTLFLPFESQASEAAIQPSFATLQTAAQVKAFFAEYFPDAAALMPNLAEEFFAHPTGKMVTVRSNRWTNRVNAVLIGDAAHAIVPFHGQGMNCAFEDCIELDRLLQQHPFGSACARFEQARLPNANAIADMALENYVEMRDTVRHAKFLLQKELAFELERRFPTRFIPRYSMVMFHHEIAYADAYARGVIQAEMLTELTRDADTLADVDMQLASELIHSRLSELNLSHLPR